jgi:uncharacterized surface protein with fasciclin (FAS1) repeats
MVSLRLAVLAVAASSCAAFMPASPAFAGRTALVLDANVVDTLATLEGPGQVWGADGIAVGKEESDFKGYDNFKLFSARLQSSGVGATLAGAGPFTVFAPTDSAIECYETMFKPFGAEEIKYCVVPGKISASAVASTPLVTLQGSTLAYKRQFRKDFVNDAIVGEKTFGAFSDFPIDVACDNGIIHSIGLVLAP